MAQISAPFRPIAMAITHQTSQNLITNNQIFALAQIVRQAASGYLFCNCHLRLIAGQGYIILRILNIVLLSRLMGLFLCFIRQNM